MSLEANKALVRRYFEEVPYHLEACDEVFAPVFRFHTLQHATLNPEADSSPAVEKEAGDWLRQVWGDFRMTVDQMIAEGDRVMVCWTFHGVHP